MAITSINSVKLTVSGFFQPEVARCGQAPKRDITYSLWEQPQISFGFSNHKYSSVIPNAAQKPSKFKVGECKNLTCPACGHKILTRNQYKTFVHFINSTDERNYIPILMQYEKYMCPLNREVFSLIKSEYGRNPETADLKGVVRNLRDEMLPELEGIQLEKLGKMKLIAATLPVNERTNVQKALARFEILIKEEDDEMPFRRKMLLRETQNFRIKDKETKQKMIDVAMSFPTSGKSVYAWIVKNSGLDKNGNERSSIELAEKLLEDSATSTDHILARNIELNHDDPTNYISMHRRCNSDKGNKSFSDWFYEDPKNRAKYIRQYLEDVDYNIRSGTIKDEKYKNYVNDCVNTMYKLSNGKVNYRRQFSEDE